MNGLDCAKCQKIKKMDIMGIISNVNNNKTNLNSCILKQKGDQKRAGEKRCSSLGFLKSRERKCLLSRFMAVQTIGSRRSKKQSCFTWRGLRVGTDLMEFRQLQEVGIFSYFVYFLSKNHVYG